MFTRLPMAPDGDPGAAAVCDSTSTSSGAPSV